MRAALAAGDISVQQARVIADTVETVHAAAGVEAADKAAGVLIEWAGQFEPTLLRKLSTRILEHVAPEIADAAARAALDAEAQRAARDRHVTLSEQHDGRLRLTGSLDAETAGLLRAAIDPLTAPSGPDDARTPGQRRHDALADLCRLALRTGELPAHGTEPAQIVITTHYDTLTQHLNAGTLDTGLHLTPDTVRRLACDAAILPTVLNTTGQVLDVGRQRRLITGPLRRALVIRDRGCTFPGCDRPPRWCDAHHIHHWTNGGTTNLHNAVLLCGHHHRHIHHSDWTVRLAGDGHPEFVPPAWLDPDQLPRRNHYHRRT
ncbi:HNH endonuclease signature motif containing protein [Micromonospora vulcania]